MNTTEPKFYEKSTVIEVEDLGDRDTHLWFATAGYKNWTASFTSRDRTQAEEVAISLAKAKDELLRYPPPATPETDHDFAEVE